MLSNTVGKFTTTGSDWELQRKAYIQQGELMNAEFERFKKFGRVTPSRTNSEYYTLPGRSSALYSGESVRLPNGYRLMRVYSGSAWVTFAGMDHILRSGQDMTFDLDSSDTVISCISEEALDFEITR